MKATVTAAMIVRDERTFISGCLDSLIGIVDNIVVVDTGSVDETRELCRAKGVEPLEYEWSGDFAAARNYALSAVQTDWTLYIDADERLVVPVHGLPRAQMADANNVALTVNFRAKVNSTTFHEIRLFRNTEAIRFQGRIHESIHPDIQTLLRAGDNRMEHTDLGIDHFGYEGDLTHKHKRNLSLLEKAVVDDPDRVYLRYALGEALLGLGRESEGVAELKAAIELSRKFSGSPKQVVDGIAASVMLVRHYLRHDPSDALKTVEEARSLHPDLPVLRYLHARCMFEAKTADYDPLRIVDALDHLISEDASSYSHPLIAFSQEYFRSLPWSLKGAVYAREKNFKRAAEAFQTASDLDPSAEEHRIKAAYFTMASAKAHA
ncbi:MAG: glycosyltransferase [Pseudomonadota bacterium]